MNMIIAQHDASRPYIRRSKNGTFRKYMYKVDIELVKSFLYGLGFSLLVLVFVVWKGRI